MMVHFPQHWSACPGYTILANFWVISSERQRIRQDLSPAQEELQDGEEATYSRPASLPWELEPITSPLTLICKMRTLDWILPRSLPVLTFYDQSASFPISWKKENLFLTFSSMKLKIKSPVKWKFISHSRVARNEVNNAGLKSRRTSARRHCVLHLMNPPSNRVLLLFLFHRWRNTGRGAILMQTSPCSISQMKKPKHGEVWGNAQGHTTGSSWIRIQAPVSFLHTAVPLN